MTSRYQILDKDTIIDMFRTKLTSHRISHLGLRPRCDIADKSILAKQINDSIYKIRLVVL
jgi:hypothetical protein